MRNWVIKILGREAASVLSSFFVLCFAVMFAAGASAQEGLHLDTMVGTGNKFIYPVDYAPMSLSGTYGELRSNHFHGGVDFRVGGVSGAPILAAADGYVSKITVSPSGYGNALYLTHANGYVTVYGHMQKFADEIQAFVRDDQYHKESFAVSLELDSLFFPVRQGDIIGYAGNTGSSGGPHLHFEIRDEKNLPLDYLERGYIKTVDNMPPVFNRVEFFGYSQVYGAPKTFRIERPRDKGAVIKVPMYFYAAIDATDKMEGTNAKLAVKEYKVFLDTVQVYSLNIGDVPFNLGRYINTLTEYSLRVQRKKAFVKTYVEPGNMLAEHNYVQALSDGIMVLPDTLKHKVRIETYDYKGNRSEISYTVQRVDSLYTSQMGDKQEGVYAAWYLANIIERPGFKLTIPAASLYSSTYIVLDSAATRVTPYAPVWNIHKPEVPLHTPATIYIKYTGPDSLASKAMLASVSANGRLYGAGGGVVEYGSDGKGGNNGDSTEVANGVGKSACGTDVANDAEKSTAVADVANGVEKSACGTDVVNDAEKSTAVADVANGVEKSVSGTVGKSLYVSGKLYSFGNYTVAVDTTAPHVKANFNNGAVLKGSVISFTIRDRMSGIRSYRVEIDGHWVLAEFDAKTARLRVPLKDARIKRGIVHKAVATVIDNKGNETVVKRSFKW